MHIIKIKIGSKTWANNEMSLIERIALIVQGTDKGVRLRTEDEQNSGSSKWAINELTNDWWSKGIEEENGEKFVTISYRYGGGNAPMMEALKTFLEWTFD